MIKQSQTGMSLTEMLISLAVSMVVIGGVVSIYTSTIGSSSATLKASKLNQELTAVLSVMANDIRRAGFAQGAFYTNPQNNPFSQPNNTALQVTADYLDDDGLDLHGDCITYAYDAGSAGLQATDLFGFRLEVGNDDNGVIQMRSSDTTANSCTNDDNWVSVTDDTIINIKMLSFSTADSQCLNTREPNGLDENGDGAADDATEYSCDTANAGDVLVTTREVNIIIEGELATDTNVRAHVEQRVRVRNDMVTVQGS